LFAFYYRRILVTYSKVYDDYDDYYYYSILTYSFIKDV